LAFECVKAFHFTRRTRVLTIISWTIVNTALDLLWKKTRWFS